VNATSRRLSALLLCLVLAIAGVYSATSALSPGSGSAPASAVALAVGAPRPPNTAGSKKPTPGVELARTLSLVTGVAISPLLGVGAVGAYHYWAAPEERRPNLPWYAQPWFWIPALVLVTFIGVKDILGTAAPTALKKPFDVAETMENKVSGLIAAGAFLPLIISVFPEAVGNEVSLIEMSPLAACGFAAVDAGSLGNALLVPFALAIFAVVWLASHAINILILLSPFTTLDTLLKALRLALLSLVGASAFANPWFGAAVAVVVIAVAYFMAGWSFRLTILGTVYVWDWITLRCRRFQPGTESNRMFTARRIDRAPSRTYGRLVRGRDGGMVFEYRPWLFLKKERLTLTGAGFVVGRGVLYPEVVRVERERATTLFILPPRYCGHEEAVARAYGLAGVRDVGIRRGISAGLRWLKGLFKTSEAGVQKEAIPS
jgi:hypothetical protein